MNTGLLFEEIGWDKRSRFQDPRFPEFRMLDGARGRKAELPLATGSLWANPSSFTMAIGNPLSPWKL